MLLAGKNPMNKLTESSIVIPTGLAAISSPIWWAKHVGPALQVISHAAESLLPIFGLVLILVQIWAVWLRAKKKPSVEGVDSGE